MENDTETRSLQFGVATVCRKPQLHHLDYVYTSVVPTWALIISRIPMPRTPPPPPFANPINYYVTMGLRSVLDGAECN